MRKYVIVQLLEDLEDGYQFPMTNWPLHITLASNFVINKDISELEDLLRTFSIDQTQITSIAGDDDYFAPQRQVHVTKIHMSSELRSLHTSLVSMLRGAGALFDDPQYIEDGYIAHATVQHEKRLKKAQEVIIDSLTLVDMFSDNDINKLKIIKTFKFTIE